MASLSLGTARVGTRPSAKQGELNPWQKMLVGGLGGITPIIATLMAGEHDRLPLLADEGALEFYLGFGMRAALFFAVGAVFVWLHQEVKGRWPVFRLGVTAPALIAAMIGSAPAEAAGAKSASGSAWDFGSGEVRVAALQSDAAPLVLSDALPFDIVYKKCSILDGFLGRKCKR